MTDAQLTAIRARFDQSFAQHVSYVSGQLNAPLDVRGFLNDIATLLAAYDAACQDLKLNASLLARQCDLAREAEVERDAANVLLDRLAARPARDESVS